ncbi:MAG: helix-turn-helix transcriptional regulator [Aggregatilineales bacterium]
MNRTDRLLAIILELQARRHRRAEDLAATFETSKRTIYRDMQALAQAGVPIVSTPGKGYALVEGYFLPPVRFTVEEATMLLLGSDLIAQAFDTDYRAAAHAAGRKISGLLPASEQTRVAELRERIRFVAVNAPGKPGDTTDMQTLRQAILSTRTVRFRYHARHSAHAEPDSVREVDPYNLTYVKDTWQLLGYCHLRQDMRMFRISRMADLVVLNRPFDRAEHLEMWQRMLAGMSQPRYSFTSTLVFDNEVARWVQEDPYFYIADRQPTPDGLRVTLRAPDEHAVLQWILSWGQHVQVLEPGSLRVLLINETQAALERWKNKIQTL